MKILRMTGRCSNGFEHDGGNLYHAVDEQQSACGAKPGKRSAGWSLHEGEALTCQKCVAKTTPANCPFCGASAAAIDRPGADSMREPHQPMVSCTAKSCGAKITKSNVFEAVTAWNRRAKKRR